MHSSAPTLPCPVLYESQTLLALDKPAGIIVHADGTGAETLSDLACQLLSRHDDEQLDYPSNPEELQALQRLDRETTGIVLYSRQKSSQPLYDRMIAEHRATKRYLAIVEGAFPWHERTFDSPIGRDRHDARRMRISRTGKRAVSHAKLLRSATIGRRTFSLLSVVIETGRKHQIRVHLSSSGFPIVGDVLYGHNHPLGLMLHARELSFTDPVDGNPVDIVSPVPARFAAIAAEFESEAPIGSRRS